MAEMPGFSPPMRGCSRATVLWCNPCNLFPAHAGVILITEATRSRMVAFPRLCGGDPCEWLEKIWGKGFSPPMRG